ncbi:hypothetical protein [Bradyrhizobium sp. ORS 111]|uniref:hypothetical protein n=1 Tax=Bradyrhizobium sp. ORS 111 TaxID=1685958 RepID=UPI00388E250F
MKIHAAVMLIATLMLSGTVLAQSSGPTAGNGQAGNVTTTGQALNSAKKTGDSGPPIDKAARQAKPDAGAASNTVGVNRGTKADRRNEHYP